MASKKRFDPEGDGYDYDTASRYGMRPAASGPNKGHWGSRVELSAKERPKGTPEGTGVMLKGRKHKTWSLAIEGEEAAGYDVVKMNGRYYSTPKRKAK